MDYDVLYKNLKDIIVSLCSVAADIAECMARREQAQADAVANAHGNIIPFPGIKINSEVEK